MFQISPVVLISKLKEIIASNHSNQNNLFLFLSYGIRFGWVISFSWADRCFHGQYSGENIQGGEKFLKGPFKNEVNSAFCLIVFRKERL